MSETLARSAIAPVSFALYAQDFPAFAEALGRSFARYGFAVVSDHGLDQARIDAAVAGAKAFFALPEEVKRRYTIEGVSGQRGYTPFGVETAKGAALHDLKEFWHTGRELPPGHPYRAQMPDNLWPTEVPAFRTDEQWLFDALERPGRQAAQGHRPVSEARPGVLRARPPSSATAFCACCTIRRRRSTGPISGPAPMRISTPSPCSWAPKRRGWR